MIKFYRNASFVLLGVVLLTIALVYAGIARSKLEVSLFPSGDNTFLWDSAIEPKVQESKTRLTLKNEVGTVEYDFFLDPEKPFPYTHYSIYFIDQIQSYMQVDLSRYSGISFQILCDPKNVLLFALFSFDEKVTKLSDMSTRRVSSTAFSCDHHWATVNLHFADLDTPHWWLGRYGYDFSDTGYQLNKTMGFAWINSLQSPVNTPSYVRLTDIKLIGNDSRITYLAVGLSVILWILFFVWLVRRYVSVLTLEIKERVRQDQPFIAYKKLSIEPQRDKEKSAVIKYVATEYTNPDLSLEAAAAALGVNRTKINDILKDELGLTFTAYLNKLRLTEAARLLSENEDVNVSEIAYSVGYNSVSYFNKLFKNEYGCAPKTFKEIYLSKDQDSTET